MLTQLEFEKKANEVMERLGAERDMLCGMLEPGFVACCAQEKTLTLRYRVLRWELNPNGVLHGGALYSMLDTTLGILVNGMCDTKCVTVSLQTSFLRPAREGDDVIVRGTATFMGRSIVHCEAHAWIDGAPEKLIATGAGVFKP